jgi:uncharacterized protein YkwD
MLAACGGGGGESSAPPLAVNTPPAAPAPAPPAGNASRATCELPNFQADLLAAINAARQAGANCGTQGRFAATTPLAWNNALASAALVHSDDMVAHNFFSHTGSDGRSAGDRATAAGYLWSGWGENIAAGYGSASAVMAGWMASPGHCANLLAPNFQHVGVACVKGSVSNTYSNYWSMALGKPR